MKGVVVLQICGGGCDSAFTDSTQDEPYEGGIAEDTTIWCEAKQEEVHADSEGCQIALPVTCPHCQSVVIEDD